MSDLNPRRDIDIRRAVDMVVVKIPIDPPQGYEDEWKARFEGNMRAHRTQGSHDLKETILSKTRVVEEIQKSGTALLGAKSTQRWVQVPVPVSWSPGEVTEVLDLVQESIDKTDAATGTPTAAETDAVIREWWSRQHP